MQAAPAPTVSCKPTAAALAVSVEPTAATAAATRAAHSTGTASKAAPLARAAEPTAVAQPAAAALTGAPSPVHLRVDLSGPGCRAGLHSSPGAALAATARVSVRHLRRQPLRAAAVALPAAEPRLQLLLLRLRLPERQRRCE